MKKIWMALAIIGLASFICSEPSWAAKYQHRLIQQQKKIWRGFNKGQLTRHETRRLMKEQYTIRRNIRSFARDGQLTRKEKKRINRWLYKSDRHIRRLMHNNHHRNQHWRPHQRYRGHVDRYRWHVR